MWKKITSLMSSLGKWKQKANLLSTWFLSLRKTSTHTKTITQSINMVSPALLGSVKREEGYVGTVYKDHLGKDTIGYGFLVRDLCIDEDIASLLLQRYLEKLVLQVNRRHPWVVEAPGVLRDVVYEMCYQLGVDGFSRFKKTIKLMMEGQYEAASIEMLDSLWAKKQTPPRAKRLSDKVLSLA